VDDEKTEPVPKTEDKPNRMYILVDSLGQALQIVVPHEVKLVPPFNVFEAEPKTNTGLILPPN